VVLGTTASVGGSLGYGSDATANAPEATSVAFTLAPAMSEAGLMKSVQSPASLLATVSSPNV